MALVPLRRRSTAFGYTFTEILVQAGANMVIADYEHQRA